MLYAVLFMDALKSWVEEKPQWIKFFSVTFFCELFSLNSIVEIANEIPLTKNNGNIDIVLKIMRNILKILEYL